MGSVAGIPHAACPTRQPCRTRPAVLFLLCCAQARCGCRPRNARRRRHATSLAPISAPSGVDLFTGLIVGQNQALGPPLPVVAMTPIQLRCRARRRQAQRARPSFGSWRQSGADYRWNRFQFQRVRRNLLHRKTQQLKNPGADMHKDGATVGQGTRETCDCSAADAGRRHARRPKALSGSTPLHAAPPLVTPGTSTRWRMPASRKAASNRAYPFARTATRGFA